MSLLAEYRRLSPSIDTVYVLPDIRKAARQDPYWEHLYEEFTDTQQKPLLETMSVFRPHILWRKLRGEQSIVHHHFYEIRDFSSFLHLFWKTFWLTLYRLAGGKIVWTVHNVYPHNRTCFRLIKTMRKYIAHVSHRLHVHCREGVSIMSSVLGVSKEKFFVIAHPLYPSVLLARNEARTLLLQRYPVIRIPEGETPFVLMFGAIARYKGVKEVLDIFSTTSCPVSLLIAGSVKKGNEHYVQEITQMAQDNHQIQILPHYIPQEDIPLFLNAADYMLFNYTDILTSGGVAWAQSYRKRMIIPRKGCLKELEGSDILSFGTQEELREILRTLKNPHHSEKDFL